MAQEACPESSLLDFVEGKLSAAEAERIERHIDGCPSCRQLAPRLAVTARPGQSAIVRDAPRGRLANGARLGDRFRVLRPLGRGGMGEVYEAHDESLRQRVAIKVMSDAFGGEEWREMLRNEIVLARRVTHPNVCRVHDMGAEGDLAYITMELLVGTPLSERLRQGLPSTAESVDLLAQICDGLAAAHAAGVVHRDLKPSNVMLRVDGTAVLMDFGIAHDTRGRDPTGIRAGTPAYWAPEQALGEPTGPWTDIWGVGALACALLRGRPPAGSLTDAARDELPDGLRAVVARCLDPAPESRWESAEELGRALRETGSNALVLSEGDALVGREDELRALSERFDSGAAVVTVLGPPGIGKSRLAQSYARAHAGRPGLRVELSDAANAEALCTAVSSALGAPLDPGAADETTLVGQLLDGRGRLLVWIDGAENAVEPLREALPRWVELAPRARFLITSLARIGAPAEHTFELGPLSLTGDSSDALTLFLSRARAARHDVDLDGEERDAARELVGRLEGVPLAIELAAARCALLRPSEIVARLGEPGAAPLRDAILDGWRHLTAEESAALARLTVISGPFTVSLAERVIGTDPARALDVLAALRDKSMLRAAPPSAAGESRLRLYSAVRAFADEQLDPEIRRAAHDAAVVAMTARAATRVRDAERGDASALAELLELREPLLSLMTSPTAEIGATRHLEALFAIQPALARVGPWDEYRRALNRIVAEQPREEPRVVDALLWRARLLASQGALADAVRDADDAIRRADELSDRARHARALTARASICDHTGTFEAGRRYALEALARAEEARATARAACVLGGLEVTLGMPDEAAGHLTQALETAREAGDSQLMAETLLEMWDASYHAGDLEEAVSRAREAQALLQVTGDARLRARAMSHEALVLRSLGDFDGAQALYEKAIGLSREIGGRRREGVTSANYGMLCLNRMRYHQAQQLIARAIEIAREVGALRSEATATGYLAMLKHELGDLDEAARMMTRIADDMEAAGFTAGVAMFTGTRADVLSEMGHADEALATYDRACALFAEADVPGGLAQTAAARGALAADLGCLDEAGRDLKRAFECVNRIRGGQDRYLDFVRVHEGHLLLARGDVDAARERLSVAITADDGAAPLALSSYRVRFACRRLRAQLEP